MDRASPHRGILDLPEQGEAHRADSLHSALRALVRGQGNWGAAQGALQRDEHRDTRQPALARHHHINREEIRRKVQGNEAQKKNQEEAEHRAFTLQYKKWQKQKNKQNRKTRRKYKN